MKTKHRQKSARRSAGRRTVKPKPRSKDPFVKLKRFLSGMNSSSSHIGQFNRVWTTVDRIGHNVTVNYPSRVKTLHKIIIKLRYKFPIPEPGSFVANIGGILPWVESAYRYWNSTDPHLPDDLNL